MDPPSPSIYKEGKYKIYYCPTFLNLRRTSQTKSKEMKGLKLCYNCFKITIPLKHAISIRVGCHKKHNTLLHISSDENTESKEKSQVESSSASSEFNDINRATIHEHDVCYTIMRSWIVSQSLKCRTTRAISKNVEHF